MHKKVFSLFVLTLIISGCATNQSAVKSLSELPVEKEKLIEVEAEAEVVPVPENLLVTKRDALEAVKRKAVEKAVGVYITGQQMVSKAVLIQEKIFSKTAGYIKNIKVLSEGQAGEFYKIRVSAKVRLGDVKKDIDGLGLMIKTTAGNPRVVVIIDEIVDGVLAGTTNAETNIIGQLLKSGYKVVDQQQLEKIKEENILKAISAGDEKAAATIGKKFDADVSVVGKVNTVTTINEYGSYSASAQLSAKVIKVSSGDMLFAVNKISRIWDITKEAAVSIAIDMAAKLAGEEFVKDIAPKLSESNVLKLTVSGVTSINKLEDFKKLLKIYESVFEVTVRSVVEDTVEMEIELHYGTAADFASRLNKAKGWDIKISEVGGHSITAEIR